MQTAIFHIEFVKIFRTLLDEEKSYGERHRYENEKYKKEKSRDKKNREKHYGVAACSCDCGSFSERKSAH